MKIYGQLVDIHKRDIYPAVVTVSADRISTIERVDSAPDSFIIPGLIDAHIHIESSMVTPGAFAMAAVRHGTCGAVSDPHEIANVLGIEGVEFMLRDAAKVPLKFFFGAPSCVPATSFESSGAVLGHEKVRSLLERDEIKYLSEMMNFPGVVFDDPEVMNKISWARSFGKPVDGHAPGLSGEDLKKYVSAGITTDHECSTIKEALEKISLGMKILIREGSAARNLDALKELYKMHPRMVMLCSDDLHPEMLREGHIDKLVARLINEGYDIFDVIRSATLNPDKHYNLEMGMLRAGDKADFVIVDSLQDMNVQETWIGGRAVYKNGKLLFDYEPGAPVNNFNCMPLKEGDITVRNIFRDMRAITASEGELLTGEAIVSSGVKENVEADTDKDILKIVVKDRYADYAPAIGFIKGFGLNTGAFASSIAHDSHNIIAVGTSDDEIIKCINRIVELKGGLAASSGEKLESLQLNIAGIMTTRPCDEIARDYENLNRMVHSMGCQMKAPFMTLSFMALLVIPDLKIGDRGLFDVRTFQPVSLFV